MESKEDILKRNIGFYKEGTFNWEAFWQLPIEGIYSAMEEYAEQEERKAFDAARISERKDKHYGPKYPTFEDYKAKKHG